MRVWTREIARATIFAPPPKVSLNGDGTFDYSLRDHTDRCPTETIPTGRFMLLSL